MLRCEQTATLAGWPEATVEPDFTECDYGQWTGRPLSELSEDPLWQRIQNQPSAVTFPDGESLTAMRDRVVSTAATIARNHDDEDVVAIVSHGDPIKAVLSDALGQDFDDFQRIVVAPASISIVQMSPGKPPGIWCLNANTEPSMLLARRPGATVGGGDIPGSSE